MRRDDPTLSFVRRRSLTASFVTFALLACVQEVMPADGAGEYLYVENTDGGEISVIRIPEQLLKRLPFADAVRPFAMLRDEKTLFVQLSRLHGFQVVDLKNDKVVRSVNLPPLPEGTELPQFFPHTYNHGLEISPDERYLFAAGSAGNFVAVYRLPSLELAAQIPVGKEPNWIVFDKAGKFAYVSNQLSDTVSVISVGDLKEVTKIPVGKFPQRMKTVVVPRRTGRKS